MITKKIIIEKLEDKKASNITIIKIKNNIMADFFIIASANSVYHLKTLSNYIKQELNEHIYRIDGTSESEWIVLDAGSILIHLFTERLRRIYNLEELGNIEKGGNN